MTPGDRVHTMITDDDDPAMILMLTAADAPTERVAGLALEEFGVLEALRKASPILSAQKITRLR